MLLNQPRLKEKPITLKNSRINNKKLFNSKSKSYSKFSRLQALKSENVTAHSNNEKANYLNKEIAQATQKLVER
jgi:hypothetical protein